VRELGIGRIGDCPGDGGGAGFVLYLALAHVLGCHGIAYKTGALASLLRFTVTYCRPAWYFVFFGWTGSLVERRSWKIPG
jgi:hypothetical protein